eukprot:scaffold71649_cov60-Phaeocystis_antarctica.AAC.4
MSLHLPEGLASSVSQGSGLPPRRHTRRTTRHYALPPEQACSPATRSCRLCKQRTPLAARSRPSRPSLAWALAWALAPSPGERALEAREVRSLLERLERLLRCWSARTSAWRGLQACCTLGWFGGENCPSSVLRRCVVAA